MPECVQTHDRRSIGTALALAWLAAWMSGCATPSTGRAGDLAVSAPLSAAVPAIATRTTERETVTLPAGSIVRLESRVDRTAIVRPVEKTIATSEATPATSVEISAPATLTRETIVEETRSAVAHAPPSARDLARADGVRTYWRASLACFALGLGLIMLKHWMAAGCAFAAAIALPVLASALSSGIAERAALVLIAAAVVFFVAWHWLRMRGKLAPEPEAVPS